MNPPAPTFLTFAGFFIAALAVGMGWALGNLLIVWFARLVTF